MSSSSTSGLREFDYNEKLKGLIHAPDGCVRAQSVLNALGSDKSVSGWFACKKTIAFLEKFKADMEKADTEPKLPIREKRGKFWYIHPGLIDPLAIWADPAYAAYFFQENYMKRGREQLTKTKTERELPGDDGEEDPDGPPGGDPEPRGSANDWSKFYHYMLYVSERRDGKVILKAVRRNNETFRRLQPIVGTDACFFHIDSLPIAMTHNLELMERIKKHFEDVDCEVQGRLTLECSEKKLDDLKKFIEKYFEEQGNSIPNTK